MASAQQCAAAATSNGLGGRGKEYMDPMFKAGSVEEGTGGHIVITIEHGRSRKNLDILMAHIFARRVGQPLRRLSR